MQLSAWRVHLTPILEKAMSIQLDETKFTYDQEVFKQKLPQYYRSLLHDFRRIVHSFISFNAFFCGLLSIELVAFFSFLPLFTRSAFFAVSLSAFFLTLFSYLVLAFYYNAQKPDQFHQLKDRFIQSCRQTMGCQEGEGPSLAAALCNLVSYLHDFETQFYQLPEKLQPLSPFISRFSSYCYRGDVFQLKQLLIRAAIEEHLKQIRLTPTDLELHASLANVYVLLSKLYTELLEKEFHSKKREALEKQFQSAAKLAIEEFQILSTYAPNDPWVHEQLASGYRDLKKTDQEIREMEILRSLRPQDKEILSRLGTLYFFTGQNAQGLCIYDELRQLNLKMAEELIANYGQQVIV